MSLVPSSHHLYLIAAACESLGIGFRGDLPWRLRKELAHFNRMTTKTVNPEKQNAVIMGRKTWDSIPQSKKPLPKRFNVVISRDLKEVPKGAHYIARNLNEAVSWLKSSPMEDKVEKLWVVGGSGIYKMAMEAPSCYRIYLTRVLAKFDCDVFFPEIQSNKFHLVNDPEVPSETQEENGIQYHYEVYENKLLKIE